MANSVNNSASEANAPKKADLILKAVNEISSKQDALSQRTARIEARLSGVDELKNNSQELPSDRIDEICATLKNEYAAIRTEMKYLAAQSEQIFLALSENIANLSAQVAAISVPAAKEGAAQPVDIDYDLLAQKVAELLPMPESLSPDYIASKVAEQIVLPSSAVSELDEEEFADKVAIKVGALRSEDFDIIVDDDGCASISKELADKLDYDIIAASIAEKLRSALDLASAEPDYDEMASRISEKLTVSSVNEDAIADKTAAALSNYMPEIDPDDIADKVAEQVISAIPAVDNDSVVNGVSEKLIASQADHDYNIVIDEEGLQTITERVYEKVCERTDVRFDGVDGGIRDIKAMLVAGAIAGAASESEREEQDEEALVTVSAIIDEEEAAEEVQGGVDFANMMKYNRSFMARIIQGSDEQKNYYGSVKNALLSYKKVNSNIAWGAERFHKGRETVARLKIRGKTLCLYLALDPAEYSTSVYHHTDVSDNKSLSGTPMAVKIKSPRGLKKAIRLIDEMLQKRGGIKTAVAERDYAAMYPYETIEELIEDGLVKDVSKNK